MTPPVLPLDTVIATCLLGLMFIVAIVVLIAW